jgi:hypothetical protein
MPRDPMPRGVAAITAELHDIANGAPGLEVSATVGDVADASAASAAIKELPLAAPRSREVQAERCNICACAGEAESDVSTCASGAGT